MAESVTLARPYAQAVFRLAQDSRSLAAWSARLQPLSLIAAAPEMAQVIGNPRFSAKQIADLFVSLCGEPTCAELTAFVHLLAENERFAVLGDIQSLFEAFKDEAEGVREALITSAFPIDDAQLAPLVSQLETHFGRRLQARVDVDAALIGGVRVAVGDQILDASVRGKLDAMAAALKN